MAKFNPKATDTRKDESVQLAGGFGAAAARQDAEALLRRAVLGCLLWEDLAYESGEDNAENIAALVPQVKPEAVAEIAIEAREKQKLRHVPLWLVVQMLKHKEHKPFVREVIKRTVTRADQLTDLVALYWKDGKKMLPRQLKAGLRDAFATFDAYQLGKYNRANTVKLRDVLALCHAKPPQGKEEIYKQVMTNTLPVPDTWEVALSTGKDKKATWERLIAERKLGGLAFLRNLRNMEQAGADPQVIRDGLTTLPVRGLLPLNFFAAKQYAPRFTEELEGAMFRAFEGMPKLAGHTVLVVDCSGSMQTLISSKSAFSRLNAAVAMAVMARETCERVTVYATAGSDLERRHETALVETYRGFALAERIKKPYKTIGSGGIFTRQALEYIKDDLRRDARPERIIVFSDSQDCERLESRIPAPFGHRNYIIDVSCHRRGINYKGIWTAEVSGWSEHFLTFILGNEGLEVAEDYSGNSQKGN